MGKRNFERMYAKAHQALAAPGQVPTYKVSAVSDHYDPYANFAGVILYHHHAQFRWWNSVGLNKNHYSQFGHIFIQCTDDWPEEELREAGAGRVHDYLYWQIFESNFDERLRCCGGFAVMQGYRQYSSIWLNDQENDRGARNWCSDGSKFLSPGEQSIVDAALDAWESHGPGAVVASWAVHNSLLY